MDIPKCSEFPTAHSSGGHVNIKPVYKISFVQGCSYFYICTTIWKIHIDYLVSKNGSFFIYSFVRLLFCAFYNELRITEIDLPLSVLSSQPYSEIELD